MECSEPELAEAIRAGRLVVFTDVDGTLLDHETYAWQPAAPALEALRARAVPVVLTSSKTLAELAALRAELGLDAPVVAENGADVDVPAGYFSEPFTHGAQIVDRARLQQVLRVLRADHGYDCVAFFELGDDGIAAETGLTPEAAHRANQRRASEPLLWRDTEARLVEFVAILAQRGLRCVRGGRFVHLMGNVDKADAVRDLMAAFRRERPGERILSVALGDAPNDLGMLRAADVAIVIPGRHGQPMPLQGHACVIRASEPGPRGWLAAMEQLLGFGTGPSEGTAK